MIEQVRHGQLPDWAIGVAAVGHRHVLSTQALRQAALVGPRTALRYLQRAEHPQRSAALRALRAEIYLRIRHEDVAFAAAVNALELAEPYTADWFTTIAVMIDVSCWIGQPAAVQTCQDLVDVTAVTDAVELSVCAEALQSVAVYHWQDCRQARAQLGRLIPVCQRLGNQALLTMVGNGLAVMALGCQPGGYAIDLSAWTPVPGGQLCPADQTWPQYLTSRLRRRPGTHRCRPGTRRTARPESERDYL